MVDKIPDWQSRRQVWHAPKVVAVKVGDDKIVDLRDARFLSCGGNPVGVARAWICGLHQQKLAVRGKKQVSFSAFDIDRVYIQRGPPLRADDRNGIRERDGQEEE